MKQRKCREYKELPKYVLREFILYSNSGGIKELTTKDTLLASGQSKINKGRMLKRSQ